MSPLPFAANSGQYVGDRRVGVEQAALDEQVGADRGRALRGGEDERERVAVPRPVGRDVGDRRPRCRRPAGRRRRRSTPRRRRRAREVRAERVHDGLDPARRVPTPWRAQCTDTACRSRRDPGSHPATPGPVASQARAPAVAICRAAARRGSSSRPWAARRTPSTPTRSSPRSLADGLVPADVGRRRRPRRRQHLRVRRGGPPGVDRRRPALAELRKPGAQLVVTGCMAERYGDELAAALPEADAVVGFAGEGSLARGRPAGPQADRRARPARAAPARRRRRRGPT